MASATSCSRTTRDGLESAGRHDLLKQVNAAALKSYATTDASKLAPEQALQEAKGLQGAAKDAEKSGDLVAAEAEAGKAYALTSRLLTAEPTDWNRVFGHAQSEYWVGFVNWRKGEAAAAHARFTAYAALADRLVRIAPANDDGRMERVYASNNLGMLALRQAGAPAAAEPYFHKSLVELDTIAAHKPGDTAPLLDRANALGWLADSQRLQGHLDAAAAASATRKRRSSKSSWPRIPVMSKSGRDWSSAISSQSRGSRPQRETTRGRPPCSPRAETRPPTSSPKTPTTRTTQNRRGCSISSR